MQPSKFQLVAAALLLLGAAPAMACTYTEAFGFRFGEPVPPRAPDIGLLMFGGGSVWGQYRGTVPEPLAKFPIYSLSAVTNKRVVYGVTAIREIGPRYTNPGSPERKRVHDVALPEVEALKKLYSEKYGFVYQLSDYSDTVWEAKTDTLTSRIGLEGTQHMFVECENSVLKERETDIFRKENGGSIW